MGLVADLLQRLQCRRGRVEQQWLQALAAIDLLALLGQRDDRQVIEPEILQHLEPHVELTAAAVDEHQVGQHRALFE